MSFRIQQPFKENIVKKNNSKFTANKICCGKTIALNEKGLVDEAAFGELYHLYSLILLSAKK